MNQITAISPTNARLPQTYEQAKLALANCASIDECKDWADKAAALASYARQANDPTLMREATRIQGRAIRRAGELLKQIEPGQGARDGKREVGDRPPLRSEVARDAGLSAHQAKQAVRVASVPTKEFESQVESDKPPTISQLAVQGIKRPAPRPAIDLGGRDPAAFNRSLHFVAEIEDYAKSLARADLNLTLPGLSPAEAQRVRKAISQIDTIHDRIVTRI